jgi:hypothetical protein
VSNATPEINRLLRAFRRRLMLQNFLNASVRATLFFLGCIVVLRSYAWWLGAQPDPSLWSALGYGVLGACVIGVVAGLLGTLVSFPKLSAVAQQLDALGATRDRLHTALEFAGRTPGAEMEKLAVEESRSWLRTKDFRHLAPLRVPRDLRWVVVPIALLALLWWLGVSDAEARAARQAAAQAEVKETTQNLEKLAQELEKRAAATDDALLKRVAERLKQGALQVRQAAEEGKEPGKAALRELAELEQIVKDLRRPQEATPGELKALAEALQKHETTKEAAKAIEQGQFAEAAKQLEQAQKEPGAEAAQKTLQEALQHLARKKEELSKQLEKLAQQAGGGDDAERQQLLQDLSQLLNEMGAQQQQRKAQANQQKQPGGQKPMTNDDLKKLLSALQQMKDRQQGQGEGEGQEQQPGEGDQPGEGGISMLNFSEGKPGEDPGSDLQIPSGRPGSEKDKGTTQQPLGKDAGPAAEATRQEQSKGKLGAGESLSALVPSAAGGDAKATRRYKELTDAAAAAAEDTVTQENIPLGSRFLIRRYFEAIRPK